MSNRTEITKLLIDNLKLINGGVSPFNSSYTFNTNIHGNAYKGVKFIDEINDFPSLYVVSETEYRTYNTADFTEAIVESVVRCYIMDDNSLVTTNGLIQDIEHVVYSITSPTELLLQDITISNIVTDKGLIHPYGMAEIFLNARFEIFTN
mgnify:FL=1